MNYKILTLKDFELWKFLLTRFDKTQTDVYYTPEYYQLYQEYGDGLAMCFVFEENDQIALYPFLLNSINNLGYSLNNNYFDIQGAYGYNGIISTSKNTDFIEKFYRAFETFCEENNIIAEFTRFHPILENFTFSEQYMNVIFDRKTMFIDLRNKTYDEIFKQFQTTTKKQIKRAKNRYCLNVVIEHKSTKHLDIFLSIYHEAMDRVGSVKYLYFNREYFEQLLLTTDSVLFTAYYADIPVASIIALYGQNILHGHLGGAKTDYLFLSAYSLLYDEMIRYGIEHHFGYFHAGGGATTAPDDPLLIYKLHFSDTTGNFFIGKKIHNLQIYNEVIRQWEIIAGDKKEIFKNHLLKYRYV